MAKLTAERNALSPRAAEWTATQTREQFLAIAWLRWRMLVNSFRRKGGTGELIGRILLVPILAGMTIGPSVAAGIAAYFFTAGTHIDWLSWLLWATFAYCQLLNIQLGAPGSTFDPTELIRFPLSVRNYIYIRLCFGLLTPANVIVTLMSFSIALGVIVAAPHLWLLALLALGIFALTNVLFSRMIFAWVDRWLATRRAREVFTGLVFAFSIGIQWANFTFNPAYNHGHAKAVSHQRLAFVAGLYHRGLPLLRWLPPELTASSVKAARLAQTTLALEFALLCALYAAVFFTVFALRMRTEFRGENLSDAANVSSGKAKSAAVKPAKVAPSAGRSPLAVATTAATDVGGKSSLLLTLLGREFLYMRRHTGTLYGVIMPIVLVLILASRFAARGPSSFLFPAAVAYTLLAISGMSYNSFGYEATGAQLYFLAPVRMRDVVLAKNLFNFALGLTELAVTFGIISYIAGVPSVWIALSTVLWAAATLLVSTLVGNYRSFSSPKKINPMKRANKQVSQLSALIGMGILVTSALVAVVPLGLALYFHKPWAMLPVFAVLAAAALFFYERSLRGLDRFALAHREQFFAELCKAS